MDQPIEFKPLEVITKEIVLQFEHIRQSGKCNMFDVNCVQRTAFDLEFHQLVNAIEDKQYMYILQQYGNLVEYYKIDRNVLPQLQGLELIVLDEDTDDEEWEYDEYDDEWEEDEEDFEEYD